MSELKPVAWVAYCNGKPCDSTTDKQMAEAWKVMGNTVVRPLYSIPEGYVLVPEEPTQKMVDALKENLATTSRGGILRAGIALAESIKAAKEG